MFANAHALLTRLMVDREGVTAMEYGVIAAGIVLVVATAAATLGNDVSALFNSIAGSLEPVLLRRKKRRQVVIWQATQ